VSATIERVQRHVDAAQELPPYPTVKQVAALLQITTTTCRAWIRKGLLPPPLAVSTRHVRFERAAVLAALAALRGPTSAA
jgi:excisionase family DNA binding protein